MNIALDAAKPLPRTPITGIAACCARAASGHTTAPPTRVMKSRRLMPDIGVPPASALPVYRTLNLPQKGRQILGPDLNCSESGRALRQPHQRIARHTIGQEA